MRELEIQVDQAGLYLPLLGLHLDPRRPVARAFISHAHGDHAGGVGGGEVLASPETLALLAARARAEVSGGIALEWDAAGIELAALDGSSARLSVAPAGHVLGAAQLVVDHAGGRFVYTGDYQSGGGLTHDVGAPVACDQLLIESTFGLPIFSFPDRAATRAALVAWCRDELAAGHIPAVLAYALGKAQEVVRALLDAGLPVIAHGAVHHVCAAYEALGRSMGIAEGATVAYADAAAAAGAQGTEGATPRSRRRPAGRALPRGVLVVPPSAFAHPMLRKRAEVRVAYVSGWALIDASVEQHRADAAFTLSDHADHDDLVATVRATGARHVHTTLGDAEELAELLREGGTDVKAHPIGEIDEAERARVARDEQTT